MSDKELIEQLRVSCSQLLAIVDEILPQAGVLVFQDYGLLNKALIDGRAAVRAAAACQDVPAKTLGELEAESLDGFTNPEK